MSPPEDSDLEFEIEKIKRKCAINDLFTAALKSEKFSVREQAALQLKHVNREFPELFPHLYGIASNDKEEKVRLAAYGPYLMNQIKKEKRLWKKPFFFIGFDALTCAVYRTMRAVNLKGIDLNIRGANQYYQLKKLLFDSTEEFLKFMLHSLSSGDTRVKNGCANNLGLLIDEYHNKDLDYLAKKEISLASKVSDLAGTEGLVEFFDKSIFARVNLDTVNRIVTEGMIHSISELENCLSHTFRDYLSFMKLGEGGSGEVFLARKELTDIPVALKFFKNQGIHHRIAEKRDKKPLTDIIRGEITLLRTFSHKNLIRYFNHGIIEDRYFYEMEYMDGGSVASRLSSIDESQANYIFMGIIDGAAFLHDKRYLIRDFKLENSLVNKEMTEIKLSDLEMASLIDECGIVGTKGSDKYSAPEIELGLDHDPIKTDIYALGCGLLYLLTRKIGAIKEFERHDRSTYNSQLQKILLRVPNRYRPVLSTALDHDSRNRYDTVHHLKQDFSRIID